MTDDRDIFMAAPFNDTEAELKKLREERDEARRQVCRVLYTDKFMQRNHARLCGWDCFHDTDEADANNTLFNMTDGE